MTLPLREAGCRLTVFRRSRKAHRVAGSTVDRPDGRKLGLGPLGCWSKFLPVIIYSNAAVGSESIVGGSGS